MTTALPHARTVGTEASPAGWTAVAVAGLGAGLLLARSWSLTPPPCLLRQHLGVPCPACGTTRLAEAVLHGRWGPALAADAPGVLLLVVVAVVAGAQVAAWRGRRVAWLRGRALPGILVALLLAHWAVTASGGGLT